MWVMPEFNISGGFSQHRKRMDMAQANPHLKMKAEAQILPHGAQASALEAPSMSSVLYRASEKLLGAGSHNCDPGTGF